jgi:hypothetical protein
MGAPGTSKIPKTTQAPAIHGAPEPTSDLSTRAKRFERRRGRKEVGPYPVLHDGLEPDELGDAVVLGGGEPRLERRSADSCAMFNMTSAYAFLSASTCAKEEPVRPRGGRTDGRCRRRSGSGSGISPGRQPFRKICRGRRGRGRVGCCSCFGAVGRGSWNGEEGECGVAMQWGCAAAGTARAAPAFPVASVSNFSGCGSPTTLIMFL